MKQIFKPLIAGAMAIAAIGASAAWADSGNHDRRNYEQNKQSGVTFSISFSDRDYDRYDRRDRRHRYDDRGRRNGYRGQGRVVNREVFNTRYRARIVLTEQVVRTRRGPRLICTVDARGPQARYVPNKRLRRVANRNCSRRAEVRIIT